jgi:hypothetical protein
MCSCRMPHYAHGGAPASINSDVPELRLSGTHKAMGMAAASESFFARGQLIDRVGVAFIEARARNVSDVGQALRK